MTFCASSTDNAIHVGNAQIKEKFWRKIVGSNSWQTPYFQTPYEHSLQEGQSKNSCASQDLKIHGNRKK